MVPRYHLKFKLKQFIYFSSSVVPRQSACRLGNSSLVSAVNMNQGQLSILFNLKDSERLERMSITRTYLKIWTNGRHKSHGVCYIILRELREEIPS